MPINHRAAESPLPPIRLALSDSSLPDPNPREPVFLQTPSEPFRRPTGLTVRIPAGGNNLSADGPNGAGSGFEGRAMSPQREKRVRFSGHFGIYRMTLPPCDARWAN